MGAPPMSNFSELEFLRRFKKFNKRCWTFEKNCIKEYYYEYKDIDEYHLSYSSEVNQFKSQHFLKIFFEPSSKKISIE